MRPHSSLVAVLLLAIGGLPACASPYPRTYSAEAIEAKVIDAETKQPLEGVIIVAHWPLLGGIEGNRPIAQMMVMEAVTDQSGRLRFPAWGPLKRPMGYIRHEDPVILLFKPGYRHRALANRMEGSMAKVGESLRRSDWSGKTIELERFKGTKEEYAAHLGSLNNNLYPLLGSETCDWKKMPRMLLALTEQSRAFRKAGIEALYDVDLYLPVSERKCGSPRVFFKEYRP